MSQDELYGFSLALCLMSTFFSAAVAGYKNRSMFWWSLGGLFVPALLLVLGFLPELDEAGRVVPAKTFTPRVAEPTFAASGPVRSFVTARAVGASN
ncbi:MAG TPA: hypothetical protein VGM39_08780 [Kofleriaceae bacterium]|jgi:hypothetical protein